MAPEPKGPGMDTNMDVDYVLIFRFTDTDKAEATKQFEELVQALAKVGLATEVRTGESHSLLVFVKVASDEHLYGEVYRSRYDHDSLLHSVLSSQFAICAVFEAIAHVLHRVRDWLHGVRAAAPAKETRQSLESEPMYEAERLRIIYQLITNSEAEGGAGITPKEGKWKDVESIFALHNHAENHEWLKKWSTKWFLSPEDLDELRNRLGEKVGDTEC